MTANQGLRAFLQENRMKQEGVQNRKQCPREEGEKIQEKKARPLQLPKEIHQVWSHASTPSIARLKRLAGNSPLKVVPFKITAIKLSVSSKEIPAAGTRRAAYGNIVVP